MAVYDPGNSNNETSDNSFPTTNLLSYYKFDETSGTIAKDETGLDNGTYINTTFVNGIKNGAIRTSPKSKKMIYYHKKTDSNILTFNLPLLKAGESTKIYVKANNNNNYNNPDETYAFYEDWSSGAIDTTKWNVHGAGTKTFNNGILEFSGNTGTKNSYGDVIESKKTFGDGYKLIYRRFFNRNSSNASLGFGNYSYDPISTNCALEKGYQFFGENLAFTVNDGTTSDLKYLDTDYSPVTTYFSKWANTIISLKSDKSSLSITNDDLYNKCIESSKVITEDIPVTFGGDYWKNNLPFNIKLDSIIVKKNEDLNLSISQSKVGDLIEVNLTNNNTYNIIDYQIDVNITELGVEHNNFDIYQNIFTPENVSSYVKTSPKDINRYFTISLWYNHVIENTYESLYAEKTTHNSGNSDTWRNRVQVVCMDNNKIRFTIRTVSGENNDYDQIWWDTNDTISLGWHHIVCVRDNTTIKIYIDGVEQTITRGIYTEKNQEDFDLQNHHCDKAGFGTYFNSNYQNYSDIIIDEAAIWNCALTPNQITELYNSIRSDKKPPLITFDTTPISINQEQEFKISASVIDDSGVKKVKLKVTNLDNNSINEYIMGYNPSTTQYEVNLSLPANINNYNCKIFAEDFYENTIESGSKQITIKDTEEPKIIVNSDTLLNVEPLTPISISATITDNIQVLEAEIYLDGTYYDDYQSKEGNIYNFNLNGLEPGTYSVLIKAKDSSNNLGTSVPITLVVIDKEPPIITNFIVDSKLDLTYTGETYNIPMAARVIDRYSGVKDVKLLINGKEVTSLNGSEIYSTILNLKNKGTYSLKLKATDLQENISYSDEIVVNIVELFNISTLKEKYTTENSIRLPSTVKSHYTIKSVKAFVNNKYYKDLTYISNETYHFELKMDEYQDYEIYIQVEDINGNLGFSKPFIVHHTVPAKDYRIPIIKVLNGDFEVEEILEPISIIWDRSFYEAGTFELRLPLNNKALSLKMGKYILMNDKIGRITSICDKETYCDIKGETGLAIFKDRIIVPLSGQTHDSINSSAETVLKHYVTNCLRGSGVYEKLSVSFNNSRGKAIEYQARYENLYDTLVKIAQLSGLGQRVYYKDGSLIYDIVESKNRTYNQDINDMVEFSNRFGNITDVEYQEELAESKNFIYIGGSGEGLQRIIKTYDSSSSEELKEVFLDAKD
ncbi:hypothetical protein J3E07_001703, partial [Methanococcus voltae]